MWIIPGCALEQGRGWRIWFSEQGPDDFVPPSLEVEPVTATPEAARFRVSWDLHPRLEGFDRRTGVLEVELLEPRPGMLYRISIGPPVGRTFTWRSLPDRIPEEGLVFLVSSCFWRNRGKDGHYEAAVKELPTEWKPAFKLLVGDQVYTDWPVSISASSGGSGPMLVYGGRYREYWGDESYREVLGTSPNFFLCDDHEFWNDYPEVQIHLARTLSGNRKAFARAAHDLYRTFQACNNPGGRTWYQFMIGPVSFFFADTRSERGLYKRDGTAAFMSPEQWEAFEAWGDALRGPGILILGQPIFQKDGSWKDHSLSNFIDDYSRLWKVIERVLEGKGVDGKAHDIVVLSGDIHTGRLALGESALGRGVYEFIASPASMISPGGKDPTEPDYTFTVGREQERRRWSIRRVPGSEPFMTRADNVGLVRLRPGTNGRTAVEFRTWMVRPFDDRSWWKKLRGHERPQGAFVWLMKSEGKKIELQ